jgi:hypothetical protein
MKLYEITNEFESIFNDVDETGEITQAMFDAMDCLKEEFENKAISVASYIKNIEAEEEAIKQAMDGMKKRRDALKNKAESLTDYLHESFGKMGVNEINTSPYFKIRVKKCPVSVDVFDDLALPQEYLREKVVTSIDKIKLKEVLSEGVEVPGACLQRRTKLEIK